MNSALAALEVEIESRRTSNWKIADVLADLLPIVVRHFVADL
jgi:hypothetical protein